MKKIWAKIWGLFRAHQKFFIIGTIVLVLALIFLPSRIKTFLEGPKGQYETTKVKKSDLRQTISASGKVKAETQVTLKFQTSGQLAWVGVKKGDRVKKWQAIASLDKRELEKKLKKELNDYLNERWDFQGDRETYHVSTDNLDRYTLTDAIRRILEKAQFDLESTVIDVEIADLAVKLATIVSPIDGLVTEIDTPVAGVNITPATATFTIADPAVMIFEAKIDETDLGYIQEGQKAIITLDTYEDQEFEGTISKIDFAATSTSGGGTAFPAEIRLPNNEGLQFRLGMNGDAEIIIEEKTQALSVPDEAIKEEEGQSYVEILKGKKIQKVPVKTGLSTDDRIEIVSGLEEGQEIITKKKND